MNDPRGSETTDDNFELKKFGTGFGSGSGFKFFDPTFVGVIAILAMFLLFSLPTFELILPDLLRPIHWGLVLSSGWVGVAGLLRVIRRQFDTNKDLEIGLNIGFYESDIFRKLMSALFRSRKQRRGWTSDKPPDIVEHVGEILSTSRTAIERTAIVRQKAERVPRWLWGAGTCLAMMPSDYDERARTQIERRDDQAFLEDWKSAFGPLSAALATREREIMNWRKG